MDIFPLRRLGLLTVAIASAAFASFISAADSAKPNIIVIVADDLGYSDVGFHGCKDIPTPHLDELAKQSVRCTNAYVSHPYCSPTRAGLLTGRYQHRFGHENNPAYLPEDETVGLPLRETTIADVLQRAGYMTGAVGKWHLGAAPCFHPNKRGFAEYFGVIGGGHNYFEHNLYLEKDPRAKSQYFIPILRQQEPVPENEYLTDAIGREAVSFIRRHKEKPYFLYLAFNAPHTPLQAKPEALERVAEIKDEKRRTYGAMVCSLDDAIGRVLKEVRETGQANNTLIFMLSDNGGPVAVTHSSNAPLRGGKGNVYEGGIRVPYLVHWPKRLSKGSAYEAPVSSLDIFATAAAAAGAKLPDPKLIDGVDLVPYLSGEQLRPPHETLFWRTGGGTTYAVRSSTYKLVHDAEGQDELYDLEHDISEENDLAEEKPDVLLLLQEKYKQWNAEMVRPLWPNPRAVKGKNKKK